MKKLLSIFFLLIVHNLLAQVITAINSNTTNYNSTNINFFVNAQNNISNARLYYAVSPAVATSGTLLNYVANPIPANNNQGSARQFTIGSLSSTTTYNYTVQLTNTTTGAVISSSNGTFSTLTLPVLTGVTAAAITSTTANINYTIDANGTSTIPVLNYGLTSALGTVLNGTAVTGTNPTNGTFSLTGLVPGATYFYSITGNSQAGTSGASTIQSVYPDQYRS